MSCELCVETHWEVGLGMFMMQLGKEINIIAKPAHVCFLFKTDPERQPFCVCVKSKLESSGGKGFVHKSGLFWFANTWGRNSPCFVNSTIIDVSCFSVGPKLNC